MTTLTKLSIFAASIATAFFSGGIPTSILAGPEPLPDHSKDKVQMVEQPTVCDPKWYISIGGNAEFDFGGSDFVNGTSESFDLGLAFFDAQIESQDYTDVYDQPFYSIEGEVGYVVTPHIEVFGQFKYSGSPGSDRTSGSEVFFDIIGIGSGSIPLTSRFDDYESYGGQLGFRYFFLSKEARIRPYVSLAGGVTHVDSIGVATHADVSSLGGPSDLSIFEGAFFDESWVASGSALLGLEFRVTCHWAVGVNGGVRYETELEDDDHDLDDLISADPFGLDLTFLKKTNNDVGDRWYCPVTGYVKFRF